MDSIQSLQFEEGAINRNARNTDAVSLYTPCGLPCHKYNIEGITFPIQDPGPLIICEDIVFYTSNIGSMDVVKNMYNLEFRI